MFSDTVLELLQQEAEIGSSFQPSELIAFLKQAGEGRNTELDMLALRAFHDGDADGQDQPETPKEHAAVSQARASAQLLAMVLERLLLVNRSDKAVEDALGYLIESYDLPTNVRAHARIQLRRVLESHG